MDFRFSSVSSVRSGAAKHSVKGAMAALCTLYIHGPAHDRATSAKDLEVGHGSSPWRDIATSRGERAKGGGRSLVQERTHMTRLTK